VVAGVAAVAPPISFFPAGTPADQRWFAGYYDVTLDQSADLADDELATAPGGAVLAFVVAADDADCAPTWGKTYTLDNAATRFDLDRRIERLRREGHPVMISFGGAINTDLAVACTTSVDAANAYGAVIDRYGVDSIDLDIEGDTLADRSSWDRRANAIARLQGARQADHPLTVWLTLPVGPDGLTADGRDLVAGMLSAGVKLAGVNAMTMNYGIQDPKDLVDVSKHALDATASQLSTLWDDAGLDLPPGGVWELMGATPMIGLNDVTSEIFTLDDARAFTAFASDRGLARLSMWSINRDHTCGPNYPFTGTVSTRCSGVDQGDETFAGVLSNGYLGRVAHATVESDPPIIEDDPKTSPYPIWNSTTFYSAGVKVVWHGSVYVAKWWNQGGNAPDDPTLDTGAAAWSYIGPVLASDQPFRLPQLPADTYPEWDATTLYNQGDRVMVDGTGYEAKWWSRGQNPARSILDRDYSPWTPIGGTIAPGASGEGTGNGPGAACAGPAAGGLIGPPTTG
jgi:chitinase